MKTIDEYAQFAVQATEAELRETDMPWPKSEADLVKIIRAFAEKQQDYGTCVYSMSLSALAAFYYMSHVVGATGFQAGCADFDFLARTRCMKDGFRVLNYGDLLYPQYCDSEHFPSWQSLIHNSDIRQRLRAKAQERLMEETHAAPSVRAHWEMLAQS